MHNGNATQTSLTICAFKYCVYFNLQLCLYKMLDLVKPYFLNNSHDFTVLNENMEAPYVICFSKFLFLFVFKSKWNFGCTHCKLNNWKCVWKITERGICQPLELRRISKKVPRMFLNMHTRKANHSEFASQKGSHFFVRQWEYKQLVTGLLVTRVYR